VDAAKPASKAWSSSSHSDPRSAPRSELKDQKWVHSSRPETYAGRFTSIQATSP
jgi:hypothetical protein